MCTLRLSNSSNTERADASTEGDYSCGAVNVAGRTTRETRLVVFGKQHNM